MRVIEGIIEKIEARADVLGGLYGFLAPFKAEADAVYGGDIIAAIRKQIEEAKKFDVGKAISALPFAFTDPYSAPVASSGLTAAIAGYILKKLDIHPILTRIGKFAYPFGIYTVLSTLVWIFLRYLGSPANALQPAVGVADIKGRAAQIAACPAPAPAIGVARPVARPIRPIAVTRALPICRG